MKIRFRYHLLVVTLLICMIIGGCNSTEKSTVETLDSTEDTVFTQENTTESPTAANLSSVDFSMSDIPEFTDKPYVVINSNTPYFSESDMTTSSFEKYSDLDKLGRCGEAYANIGQDIMPTEERGSIGSVKPSGWHTVKYDNVDGKYLYNRCHLIGFQLAGENANNKNLITGSRYLNVDGMLPFENLVADYVKETNNHVLYRVTPIFEGNNLVATGVLMEAKSVEDQGAGILFNVFCYNSQPGIVIDYTTGDSHEQDTEGTISTTQAVTEEQVNNEVTDQASDSTYILNTNTKKFHYSWCEDTKKMKSSNKEEYLGSRDNLIAQGYTPCKHCNP